MHKKLDGGDNDVWFFMQEKFRRDDDIGTLKCGHHHHVECIKQWLLQKNTCPVCKSAAMRNTSV